jgi:hypothetical protein
MLDERARSPSPPTSSAGAIMMTSTTSTRGSGVDNPLMLLAGLARAHAAHHAGAAGHGAAGLGPIRAAEDVAILVGSAGRLALGGARLPAALVVGAVQARNVLPTDSQRARPGATRKSSARSEDHELCWTQDTVRYRSEILGGYGIPSPYEGISHWPPRVDARVRRAADRSRRRDPPRIGGAARHTSAASQLWQPFAVSERTVRRCAQQEIMPYILAPRPEDFGARCRQFLESAQAAGRDLKLGQDTGTLNFILLGDDKEALLELGERCIAPDWVRFFGEFGYGEALRVPGDPWPVGQLPRGAMTFGASSAGLALVGTDAVRRRIDALLAAAPTEWFAVQLTATRALTTQPGAGPARAHHDIIPEYRS